MESDKRALFSNLEKLDQKSVDFLLAAIERQNKPGFDYLEFKMAVNKLRQMGMDDATAFKSAFVTASTVGVSKDKLLQTGKHYLQVLSNEKQQFDLALQKQIEKRVHQKKAQVEQLKAQIAEWEEQIKALQAKIDQARTTIEQADSHIQQELSKIETTRKNFESTHAAILEEVAHDLENIEKYL